MRKFIYILVVAILAVVLWEAFGSKKQAMAPVTTSTPESVTSTAVAQSAVGPSPFFAERTNAAIGTYLTDENGRTLYTFTHDTKNVSTCTGVCLDKWPPYGLDISATGTAPLHLPMLPLDVGTIKGNNGKIQFAWKGMPLYYFAQDKAPGDTLGEGVLGSWYVVKL